jgi:VanZ family protein
MNRFLRAAWPMLVWMGVVFCLSSDFASEGHTGRFIVPLLRWLDPTISPMGIARAHLVIRKMGHVTEYAVLALLVLRAVRILWSVPPARWSWPIAALTLAVSAVYGATDEIHQFFVPSRGPSIHDVVIDTCGALLGVLLAFFWSRWFSAESRAAA